MTTRKKATITGKGGPRKLKLKKETIKDLSAKGKSKEIKGGMARPSRGCYPTDPEDCPWSRKACPTIGC